MSCHGLLQAGHCIKQCAVTCATLLVSDADGLSSLALARRGSRLTIMNVVEREAQMSSSMRSVSSSIAGAHSILYIFMWSNLSEPNAGGQQCSCFP